ncbi:MAG TPA: hypothetical protein VIH27_03310 [Nitrososphaerales archaeon]
MPKCPDNKEHSEHSLKRYKIKGEDIHAWMDEPSRIAGQSHRNYRHDLKSLPMAIRIFGEKYGAEVVENIFLDHLKADSEEDRKLENKSTKPVCVNCRIAIDIPLRDIPSEREDIVCYDCKVKLGILKHP